MFFFKPAQGVRQGEHRGKPYARALAVLKRVEEGGMG